MKLYMSKNYPRITSRRRTLLKVAGTGALLGSIGTGSAQSGPAGSKLWTFSTDGVIEGSPTVVDGTVYFGSDNQKLYAVDATDGTEKWDSPFDTGGDIYSSPFVTDGTVYIGSGNGFVFAVNANDGTEKWRYEIGSDINSSPTVADETVYIGSTDTNLYALSTTDGSEQWDSPFSAGGKIETSPTIVDGTIYIGSSDNNVYAVNAADGSEEWRFSTGDSVISSPTVADGTVYVGSYDFNMYAISGGSLKWKTNMPSAVYTSPTVSNGSVYAGDASFGTLFEFNTETGEKSAIASAEIGVPFYSSPTVAGGIVYIGDGEGGIYALDPNAKSSDQVKKWEFETGESIESSPTVVDGTLYVGSRNVERGTLYAINTGTEASSDGTRVNLGTLGHHFNATESSQNPTLARIQGSVVDAETEEPISAGKAYLIDPVYESGVTDFIEETESLPKTRSEVSIDDGSFLFDEIEAGRTIVLVVPENSSNPAYELVGVPTGETTSVSFTLTVERHLSPIDSEVERLEQAARDAIEKSTRNAADVYFDGAQVFSSEPETQDILNSVLTLTNWGLGFKGGGPSVGEAADFALSMVGIPEIEEHGIAEQTVERVNQIEDEEIRGGLETYTQSCLDTDFITSLQKTENRSLARNAFSNTPMYDMEINRLDNIQIDYEDIATQEPAEDFSFAEIKQVLTSQVRWLEGNGLASGLVFTPNGSGYTTGSARYFKGHFDGLRSELELSEDLETASLGVATAGNALSIYSGGTLASAGFAASIIGTASSYIFSMHQMYLQNQLALIWADTLTYWQVDINNTSDIFEDIVDWIKSEMKKPKLPYIDGTIQSTDIGGVDSPISEMTYAPANRPKYPSWHVGFSNNQWRRQGTNTVAIKNTGTTATPFQVTMVDTYGDGQASAVSDGVSLYSSGEETDSGMLAPNEKQEVQLQYSSDYQRQNPFNWHYMTTTLRMNGKPVDTVEDVYYVVPTIDVVPGLSQSTSDGDLEAALQGKSQDVELKTPSYTLTDATKSRYEALTVDDWKNNIGDIQPILDSTVLPSQSTVEATYDVPTDSKGVVFLLASPPNAELNIHVRDSDGRHVGYEPTIDDDVIEIPNTEYNGHQNTLEIVSIDSATEQYTVTAEAVQFFTDEAVSASVSAVDIPQRDPILGVSPMVAGTTVQPGSRTTTEITVSETSNQHPLQVSNVSLKSFETSAGEPMSDIDVSPSVTQFEVPVGGSETISVDFDAAPSLEVPADAPARFSAELTIETENAGTAVVETSVLPFDPDPDVQIATASTTVETVSVEAIDPAGIAPPSDNITVTGAYEVTTAGEGAISLSFPTTFVEETQINAYRVNNSEWEELSFSVGERTAIDIEVPGTERIVLVQETTGIASYANKDGIIDNDGVFEAVTDWQEGEIGDEMIFKIVQKWQSQTPI